MAIVFNSKNLNTIIFINKFCEPSFLIYKPSLNHFMRENAKNAKKPLKSNLARNFKYMTIVFNSNHFSTPIYTKYCCVPSFMPNKPNLNHFIRESAKNA